MDKGEEWHAELLALSLFPSTPTIQNRFTYLQACGTAHSIFQTKIPFAKRVLQKSIAKTVWRQQVSTVLTQSELLLLMSSI